ncbi:MAG: helix-turn-helix domain-containing protein [Devosia sp.]
MGLRIRSLRHQRGLSVNELAAKAGVSAGIISHIERGKANPSLRTLERIRTALGVPLSAILEETRDGNASRMSFVRRANDRPHFDVGKYPLRKEHLSPTGGRDLEVMIIHFPAGSQSEDVVIGDGEKAGLVLSGEVRLVVGDAEATLFEGDSFQFDSNVAHKVLNDSSSEASILWIMSQLATKPHL